MADAITYRVMTPNEADAASALAIASFDEFIGPGYTPLGIEEFRKYAQADAIRERIARDHFVIVVDTGDALAGMIEIRQNNHVALLFVRTKFHRQGIARELLNNALAEARVAQPDLERVTVNSSRHAVPAYEKLGFRQTGPERTVNGIGFVPMAMRLESER